MKGSIKKISLLSLILTTSILTSCQKDEIIDDSDGTLEIGQFETEAFDDLTVEEIQSLEAPFEDEITSSIPSGGRVAVGSTNLIIDALLDVLEGAVFKGIDVGKERGLSAYRIKVQLEGGSILEIVIAKEVFKILEVVGYGDDFNYDIEPKGSFISLANAFAKAKAKQDGDVVHWELELEEDNKWEYEIHIKNENGRFEVEVDAFTGEVLAINELDEEDEKEFEEDEETDEEKEERESQKLPENIKVALTAITEARLVFAEKEEGDSGERDIWIIYVKTADDAKIYLEITDDTEDLIYAKGEEGPFDYDIIIGANFISLKEALIMVNTEMQSETYYWYYERIEVEGKEYWAFVIKVKDKQGIYHRIAVDAITADWHSHETFD